jgi:penicillin amidase
VPIGARPRSYAIGGNAVTLHRDENGVVVIDAASELDLARGLGFAHAVDRGLQMLLVRLIGQGRLSELDATDQNAGIDVFMRQMGFASDADAEASLVKGEMRELLLAYRDGVETGFAAAGVPFELRLVRHRPEPWRVADTFALARLTGYVGLSQTQQNAEKLIVESVIHGVDLAKLRALFSPHLDGLGMPLVDLVSRVNVSMSLAHPAHPRLPAALAGGSGSNNWAVAPRLSASGGALACGDPHLEVNRLPAVWYEVIARLPGDFRVGITVPGLPVFVMGRTHRLSATFTYGFMDLVDYFLEDVKDGAYLRDEARHQLEPRRETVLRKGKPPLSLAVFENEEGILETPAADALPRDGLHLLRAMAGRRSGPATLAACVALWRSPTVRDAQEALEGCALSANWVLADDAGSIGYQQTGLLPLRAHSGLYPLPAWETDNLWQGFADPSLLARVTDPPEGFVASANDSWNAPRGPLAVNLSMGDSRAARIRQLLAGRTGLTLGDMKTIQRDLFSRQADAILRMALPFVPEGPGATVLRAWDRRYDAASKGAVLFERFYSALTGEVFGKRMFGERIWRALAESVVAQELFPIFDRVLLEGDAPLFFGEEGRVRLVARVAAETLGEDPARVPVWGDVNRISMTNVFFGGKLPRFLGFDVGPIAVEGGRGSIVQGQVFTAAGRTTSFCPSWRFVTDLSTNAAETALPGGPSDRRFSRWYTSDLERWRGYRYKRLVPVRAAANPPRRGS